MSAQHLLIDAGNTRLKWVAVVDGQWQIPGGSEYSDLSTLSQVLSAGFKCTIASVARTEHENQIKALLARFEIEPRWLTADAQCLDVKNTYANPKLLGVDRWMGLIAARQHSQAATLVVSLGTAMTVDALSADGVFLGGLIVPGRGMMQQSLQQGTAHVGEVAGVGRLSRSPLLMRFRVESLHRCVVPSGCSMRDSLNTAAVSRDVY